MRLLVTGGLGFIGSATLRALGSHEVVVLDDLDPAVHSERPTLPDGVEVVVGDVRDPEVLVEALSGVDAVVHLASKVGIERSLADLPDYVGRNSLGTAVLLAAMADRDVKRLVVASSMVVYGEGRYDCPVHGRVSPSPRRPEDLDAGGFEPRCPLCERELTPGLVDEDAPLDPRSAYAVTKANQEDLVRLWCREGNDAAMLRYHNVYGPMMPRDTPYSGVAAMWRSSLERGEAPVVFEDGLQRRDFVHVDDVAQANVLALEALGAWRGARAFNVASGDVRPVLDMAAVLSHSLGGPLPLVTGQWRSGDVRHVTASTNRIVSELSYVPRVGFDEGVAQFATAPLRP